MYKPLPQPSTTAASDTTDALTWQQPLPLRTLHRSSAKVLALFISVHLFGHLAGMLSPAAHQSVLEILRQVYRHPAIEALLLGCFVFQAVSGLVLLWRGRGQRVGAVAWLQALSGGYLGLFLVVHVGAVIQGRVQGLDTNLHFAAAGMHVPPWPWFFGPYYFFAVFALGTHVGCALYWNSPQPMRARILAGSMAAGMMLATCLVVLLAGGFHALEIPNRYMAPLAALAGRI